MMEAVTKLLQENPKIDASGVPLRFTKITAESFDLEMFAYVLTADYNEFLKIQSELLLEILMLAAEHDIRFTVPFQESITRTGESGRRESPSLSHEHFREHSSR